MNNDTEALLAADIPYVPFIGCPVCGDAERVTMPDDWQAMVHEGTAIRIVGRDGTCGNPWHYTNMDRPLAPTERERALEYLLLEVYERDELSERLDAFMDATYESAHALAAQPDAPEAAS